MKDIKYFSTISEFREWLEENHASERELQVGFYKKNSGRFNFSWSEGVDAAPMATDKIFVKFSITFSAAIFSQNGLHREKAELDGERRFRLNLFCVQNQKRPTRTH